MTSQLATHAVFQIAALALPITTLIAAKQVLAISFTKMKLNVFNAPFRTVQSASTTQQMPLRPANRAKLDLPL